MALLAVGDRGVLADQKVSGLGVVKFLRLPIDQLKIGPMVFGMAFEASSFLVFVEARSGVNPLQELLVTSEAFLIDRFGPRSMALCAVV